MFGAVPTFSGSAVKLSRVSFSQLKLLTNARLIHSNVSINSRYKDVAPTVTLPAASQDILLQNLRSAKDSYDVLNAINRHHSIMNSNHVVQALKSLFTLQKSQNSRLSNKEVVNNKDFRNLCVAVKHQIRHLELSELIDVLKCFGYLGLSADTKIITIILGLISKQVNDLSLQQITFLDFIMKDFKATPLVKALNIALPIVFEANLQKKCDFNNIPHLTDLLFFACRKKHMESSCNVLVDALTEKREELSMKDARNIVLALCESRCYSKNYSLLLCHALDVITDSLDKMDYYEMESILSRLYSRHMDSNDDSPFYHEELCNGCVRMVIGRDCTFDQTIWILKKLVKFNHTDLTMLDYIAKKVQKEPWVLEQCGAVGLITFINSFSSADYKPPNWELIKPLVIKACQGLTDRSELPWLRLVIDLCVMDCWLEDFFKIVFNRDFLTSFMAREYNKLDRIQLLTLDQISATLSPWPIKPRAPPDIISPIIQMNGSHITTFPLKAALHQGLGGQQYVQTGVHTSLGHFLDHVVVMRKGSYPVAINVLVGESKERVSIEDIQVPVDSKMVAVLLVPNTMCATNNERVRGLFRIHINSIEALGISVAPILQPLWNSLPDFERIPYLMRSIQEKLPSTEINNIATPV